MGKTTSATVRYHCRPRESRDGGGNSNGTRMIPTGGEIDNAGERLRSVVRFGDSSLARVRGPMCCGSCPSFSLSYHRRADNASLPRLDRVNVNNPRARSIDRSTGRDNKLVCLVARTLMRDATPPPRASSSRSARERPATFQVDSVMNEIMDSVRYVICM